ncbi:MAG: hypothetical protein ACU0DI_13430 [Paracoccaceae bacterium]
MTSNSSGSIRLKLLDAPIPVAPLAEAFEAVRVSLDRFCLLTGTASACLHRRTYAFDHRGRAGQGPPGQPPKFGDQRCLLPKVQK